MGLTLAEAAMPNNFERNGLSYAEDASVTCQLVVYQVLCKAK